jgi:hypothetical protein
MRYITQSLNAVCNSVCRPIVTAIYDAKSSNVLPLSSKCKSTDLHLFAIKYEQENING